MENRKIFCQRNKASFFNFHHELPKLIEPLTLIGEQLTTRYSFIHTAFNISAQSLQDDDKANTGK